MNSPYCNRKKGKIMKRTVHTITQMSMTFLSKGMFLAIICLLVFSNAVGAVSFQEAASSGPNNQKQASPALISDDFNACSLDTGIWNFIDPRGDATLSFNGTQALLTVPAGQSHSPWEGGNFAPRLMQPAANTNFEVEVKFESPADRPIQMQGILIEQDSQNFLRFEFRHNGTNTRLFASKIVNGAETQLYDRTISGGDTLYLRVRRQNDRWRQQFSVNGQNWTTGASFAQVLRVNSAGVFAGNAGSNPPAHTAVVDYFFDVLSPISPEDPLSFEHTITTNITGSGSVDLNPSQASYTCSEPVQLTAIPESGWAFSGWSGDLSGSDNPATILVNQNKTITASFTTTSSGLQLSVNVNGSGSVTMDPSQNEYSPGQVVSLTAAAGEGSYFSGWSGDLSGSDNPVTFTIQSSMTITATFAEINSEPSNLVSDDFNRCSIDSSIWSFIDPRGTSSLILNGSQALISVPAGISHDLWSGDHFAPRLMQTVSDTDFGVEVKFESAIGPQAQMQGILIQQDDENYLRFDFFSDGANTHIFAASFINGSPTIRYDSIIPDAGGLLYLQVNRQGDQWEQAYSQDGQNWEAAASFSHALVVTQAGLFAGNAGSNPPAHTAVIDYFFNTASPIVPEDALSFEYSLNSSVTGSGSIQRSPNKPAYTCNEPVQLEAVPATGWTFSGWSGDLSSSHNPAVLRMDSDKSVTATFVESNDVVPPVISGVQASPGTNGATITWFTDEPSTSRVQYGLTSNYDLGEVSSSTMVLNHAITLNSLQAGTTYHYRVSSTDSSGNTAVTQDATFTTLTSDTIINVWYGDSQTFGQLGTPQEWVNILGNVSDPDGLSSLTYRLNGNSPTTLSMGPDGARLQRAGDFNVDIHRTALLSGSNQVVITATDSLNNQTTKVVEVHYQPGSVWPLPYDLDWSTAASIQDVAQVVDGKWSLTGSGVRTQETGYDRLIAIGDLAWQDYEVEVPVTLHSIDFASAGGMSGDPALGLLMHWTGHTDDPIAGWQPKTGFIPFGDIAWWRWSSLNQARLEIYGSGIYKDYLPVTGLPYIFKMNVETVPGIERIYRVKAWLSDQTEPATWDLTHKVPLSTLGHGSFMLVAHHVDATFGNVSVRPLGPSTYQLTVSTVGGGSVTIDPAQSQYNPGQVVSLTATPNAGWYFAGWSGDLSGTGNPATLTMNSSKSVTAIFAQMDVEPSDIVSDDFNMCSINHELWSFINPLSDGTLVLNGSQARLSVPGGVSHDVWDSGNFAPRLMQPVTNTNFGLEVKYESLLNQQYQMQGILIEQDSSNFLRIEFHSDGVNTRLFAASFTNGSPVILHNQAIAESDAAYFLRVHRQDNQFIVLYSYDGQNWETGAGFNHTLVVTQIGVFAANAGSNPPAHTAVIDYFFNTASPIEPEDALALTHSLNTSVSGSGLIERSPDHSTYACNAAVLLVAVPEAGWAFSGWSGDLSGNDNPATITMNADKNVTATFIESQDDQPPVISGVQVNAEADSAIITWTTDEPATSRVQYGLTNAYETGEIFSGTLVLGHSLLLIDLQPGSVYHYRISSTDDSGNTAVTEDATFTTDTVDLSGITSDNFSSVEFNTNIWTFINPLEDSELTLNGSHAILSVPAGTSHDLWIGATSPRA
jgi:regulation of enolase protein 1 (concanavalin A-like superfamily)